MMTWCSVSIQLTKVVNSFTSREVEFSRLDLIRLLGWPDSGDSYRRLTKSLKRWLSVTLLYENAWRDNRKATWITKGFHILDNIELNDTRTTGEQGELFPSKIVWNKVVFDSFEAGYLKTIDYGLYIKLKHTVSRRMYRFLSKRMYFGPDLTFELKDLAFAHIGLSDSYSNNAGKIKEKLQPAIDELEAVGFLEPMTKDDRYKKDGKNWAIRFVQKSAAPAALVATEKSAPIPPLVAELITRGITAKTAAELVKQYPSELIERQIEVFDWLVATKAKGVQNNAAGYLVKSIRDDFAVPTKGFVSKAERQRREEAKLAKQRQDAENDRQKHQQRAAEKAEAEAVEAHIKQLSPAERAALETKAVAEAAPDVRESLDDPATARFRDTIKLMVLRTYVAQLLKTRDQAPAQL